MEIRNLTIIDPIHTMGDHTTVSMGSKAVIASFSSVNIVPSSLIEF